MRTKAKIYIPTRNSMQSGNGKSDKWVIKFETKNPGTNPLMGWESSSDTLSELNLEFSNKESAIEYAKKNKINFEVIEPQKRKTVKKSYADNFLK
jgi:NADH dehydrogenase (ubiquinone) Fe-S protein 4|tara:strand:- start:451 stop:735 length:285 start_codon:yes stop_codon:yes gene_type:complete